METKEIQESLDRWYRNHPKSLIELEEEIENLKTNKATEYDYNRVMKTIAEFKKYRIFLDKKYGSPDETMD